MFNVTDQTTREQVISASESPFLGEAAQRRRSGEGWSAYEPRARGLIDNDLASAGHVLDIDPVDLIGLPDR